MAGGHAPDSARSALGFGYSFPAIPQSNWDDWNSLTKSAPELVQAVRSPGGKAFHLASDAIIAFDDPELVTTTRDPGRGSLPLGLHVDARRGRP